MGKAEPNKRHPPVAVKLTVLLYKITNLHFSTEDLCQQCELYCYYYYYYYYYSVNSTTTTTTLHSSSTTSTFVVESQSIEQSLSGFTRECFNPEFADNYKFSSVIFCFFPTQHQYLPTKLFCVRSDTLQNSLLFSVKTLLLVMLERD